MPTLNYEYVLKKLGLTNHAGLLEILGLALLFKVKNRAWITRRNAPGTDHNHAKHLRAARDKPQEALSLALCEQDFKTLIEGLESVTLQDLRAAIREQEKIDKAKEEAAAESAREGEHLAGS